MTDASHCRVFRVCALAAFASLGAGCGQADPDNDTVPNAGSSGSSGQAGSSSAGSGSGSAGNDSAGNDSAGSGSAGSGSAGNNSAGGGGAGGGGAGSGSAASGSAPTGDFYPMSDGASWTYRHMGGSMVWDEVVAQTATEYAGSPAVMLVDNAGPSGSHSVTTLQEAGTRVLRVYRDEFTGATLELSTTYDPGFLRYDRAWEEQAEGHSEVAMYSRTERDTAGAITAMADRSHRFTIEALAGSIAVPAGDFDGCMRVRRERIRAPGDPAVAGDNNRLWFCPGIGKTLEEDMDTGQSEALVSCDVPGGACP
jgi:hypothetical protein